MNAKVFVISAVAFLAVAGSVGLAVYQHNRAPYQLIQQVPAEDLKSYIRDLQSPLVLVNFWASWCEPCKVEFPSIMTLRQKFAPQGFKVVFVSIDDPTDLKAAEQFLREQNVDFPTFYKGKLPLKFVTEIYPNWSGAVPTSLLMKPGLEIVDAWEGDTTLEEFEERVTRHLRGAGT